MQKTYRRFPKTFVRIQKTYQYPRRFVENPLNLGGNVNLARRRRHGSVGFTSSTITVAPAWVRVIMAVAFSRYQKT